MSEPESKSRRILRDQEVRERTGLSRVQRWRRIRKGTFPAPLQLGPNSIGWLETEIEAWLAARPRVSYALQAHSGTTEAARQNQMHAPMQQDPPMRRQTNRSSSSVSPSRKQSSHAHPA